MRRKSIILLKSLNILLAIVSVFLEYSLIREERQENMRKCKYQYFLCERKMKFDSIYAIICI
ncbi:hypothetical protein EX303_12590 [Staphylococcus epidermidis]|nr:hypothetical protein [Staphylococcus epidermidis]NAN83527.1 hypothetical protein [Staphylococcus epidermidis]